MNKSIINIILIFGISFATLGCGTNEDGSLKSTYSSCKITSSSALFSKDRVRDLNQCWNFPGDGYESKADALAWCESKVDAYIAGSYIFGHQVTLAVESTYCPK